MGDLNKAPGTVQTILAATDLSYKAGAATERAGQLAGTCGAAVILLHVSKSSSPVERNGLDPKDELLTQAHELGVHTSAAATPMVAAGSLAKVVGQVAAKRAADLLVMGAPRPPRIRDLCTGTDTQRIIWRATQPVLIVKNDPRRRYQHVAIPIDCSEGSARALEAAQAFGLLDEAHAVGIHAYAPFAKTFLSANARSAAVTAHVAGEGRLQREAVTRFLCEAGFGHLRGSLLIKEGEPFGVVQHYVEVAQPDLLVIGVRGRGWVGRRFLNSLASQVVRHTKCDILIVPPANRGRLTPASRRLP